MSKATRPTRLFIARRKQRGQTLVVALAILFVLLFIGGFFIVQIARNLTATARSRDTQQAQTFAEAGVSYCDAQLTYSEDGADWRPVPSPPITTPTVDPLGLTDPDYQWLIQGFSRVYFNGGRALVRITYDPHPDDPRSELIKIEAVGRSGDLGQGTDPTVFVQTQNPPRLRREQIAYKAIGLTDYLFYITNKDRRAAENFLGVPSEETMPPGTPANEMVGYHDPSFVLGDPSLALHPNGVNGSDIIYCGGIYSNGSLRLGGDMRFYFSPRGTFPSVSPEGLFVAGQILLAPTRDLNNADNNPDNNTLNDNDLQATVNQALDVNNSLGDPVVANAIRPSNDPKFNTFGELVRDGSAGTDANGYVRGVPRREPPLIDNYVNGSGVLRYRALTRYSGAWLPNQSNTGENGWGRGIYVDNFDDLQQETAVPNLNGASSLRAEWLNPNTTSTLKQGYGWEGPFYHAPGVLVELLGDHIRLTRYDGKTFKKPDGTEITPQGSNVLEIPLSDFERTNYRFADGTVPNPPLQPLPHDGDDPALHTNANQPYGDPHSYGVNVVIMAEGNVRVKGVYGTVTDPAVTVEDATHTSKVGRVHLTIVSGGTAYIESNVLKGDGFINGGNATAERASTCAILAKDYVCVNTTMFMAPENQTNVWSVINRDLNEFNLQLGQPRTTYDTDFSFGANPNTYTINNGANPSPIYLMLRHAALDNGSSPVAAINLFVNPALGNPAANPDTAEYLFGLPVVPPETYTLGLKFINNLPVPDPAQISPRFEQKAFPIRDNAGNFFNTLLTQSGFPNLFRFQIDQTAVTLLGSGGSTDYLLGGAMVAPLDIRIEAAMYAQEKSFFVIPGFSFNPDPNDSRQIFNQTGARAAYSVSSNGTVLDTAQDRFNKDLFPFYNEPLDVRITVFGSVAENYTASIGDQAAWLARWGYIPTVFGSTTQYPNAQNPGAAPMTVPDDHMLVHDPQVYNPAQERNTATDFRTTEERAENITRGLRFVYDPALAMPYQHPTGTDLAGEDVAATGTRTQRSLRFVSVPAVMQNGNQILPAFQQKLPALPRLPVCQGLLYFGQGDRPIIP